MLRSLGRLIRRGARELQLALELDVHDFPAPTAPSPPSTGATPSARRRAERTHPADERLVRDLTRSHAELNAVKFGGELSSLPIRVSRRMRSRLGHYTLKGQARHDQEIVISRRHIRRHGWQEAVNTLLHEMVHQWQDERGMKVDHGREFRRKARAVGIAPQARRDVAQARGPGVSFPDAQQRHLRY